MAYNLVPHPVHKEQNISQFDVFIAGSGPIGAAFARQLVQAGHNVVMVEIGAQDTRDPGAHKKNEIEYQKDIDRFVRVIQGALSTVSIPVSVASNPTLDPCAWVASEPKKQIVSLGRNPRQKVHNNLAAQAVTRGVGGMSTHWTCATPEFLKRDAKGNVFERPVIYKDVAKDDAEWKLLYDAARSMIGTSEKEFDRSIRHNIVLNALQKHYQSRGVKPLPLACHRLAESSPHVQWHGADNVFGDLFDSKHHGKVNAEGIKRGAFALLTNTRCTKLHVDPNGSPNSPSVRLAEVKDLLKDRIDPNADKANFAISAKIFVVAAGAVATPQILSNSGFGGTRDYDKELIPNLGRYITEQPMTFCQIILKQDLIDEAGNLDNKPEWWKIAVKEHLRKNPDDPLPIPFQDGEPQITIPASHERPWHIQIHRDAFSYGDTGPTVDSRVVVDLRYFGRQDGCKENRIIFETDITDAYGMPQPTFEYMPTKKFSDECSRMMEDMTSVASKLGGYLPGSNPQFMTPGLALHLGGTTRVGRGEDLSTTVADFNSQLWGFENLYVGGNGLLPTAFAANPTLTSICLAIRAAHKIHKDLTNNHLTLPDPKAELEPTPAHWVQWTKDSKHSNYPKHKHLRQPHCRVKQHYV